MHAREWTPYLLFYRAGGCEPHGAAIAEIVVRAARCRGIPRGLVTDTANQLIEWASGEAHDGPLGFG